MAVRFLRSAFRHGVSEERIRHVLSSCPYPLYAEDMGLPSGDQVLYLAPDQRGVPLEVPTIEDDLGDVVAIHAMRLRTGWKALYRVVMEHRGDTHG